MAGQHDYRPTVSTAQVERIRDWHERAYAGLQCHEPVEVSYLGMRLIVPPDVGVPDAHQCAATRNLLDAVGGDAGGAQGLGNTMELVVAGDPDGEVIHAHASLIEPVVGGAAGQRRA